MHICINLGLVYHKSMHFAYRRALLNGNFFCKIMFQGDYGVLNGPEYFVQKV